MPDRLRTALLQLGLAALVLVVVGALAGVVWEWVWSPPLGVTVDHRWVAQDEANLRGQFSGTGWYVVVGALAGLVGGAAAALLLDRVPIATLIGVAIGSLLGAAVMYRVGVALGPDDPDGVARGAKNGTQLPAALAVSGHSPWVALPAGALVAMALVFLGLSAAHRGGVRTD
jgi:disulfide bond formation protein DsbB